MRGTLYYLHTGRRSRYRIGTDGAASSGNGLNILNEARTAALVQRHDHWDPTLLPAKDIFAMITKDSKDWVAWDMMTGECSAGVQIIATWLTLSSTVDDA